MTMRKPYLMKRRTSLKSYHMLFRFNTFYHQKKGFNRKFSHSICFTRSSSSEVVKHDKSYQHVHLLCNRAYTKHKITGWLIYPFCQRDFTTNKKKQANLKSSYNDTQFTHPTASEGRSHNSF